MAQKKLTKQKQAPARLSKDQLKILKSQNKRRVAEINHQNLLRILNALDTGSDTTPAA